MGKYNPPDRIHLLEPAGSDFCVWITAEAPERRSAEAWHLVRPVEAYFDVVQLAPPAARLPLMGWKAWIFPTTAWPPQGSFRLDTLVPS